MVHCPVNELRTERNPKKDQWSDRGLKLEESLRSLLGLGAGGRSGLVNGWNQQSQIS